MTEITRILDQLRRSFESQSWHGPAVLEALAGVTAEEAAFRAAPGVHSIEELVLHMATWKRVVAERIQGRNMEPTPGEDWPRAGPADDARWTAALVALKDAHRALVAAAGALDDALLEAVPVGDHTRYFLLHGAVQHDLYHAGQIVLLVKLARARRG